MIKVQKAPEGIEARAYRYRSKKRAGDTRGNRGKKYWVCLEIDGEKYLLSTTEAFRLSDQLTDSAEEVITMRAVIDADK